MQITIDVPDSLGQKLQQFGHRLPELLERGLQELQNEEQPSHSQDEQEIMALLVSQPSPAQVLAICPSTTLQARVSDLLQRSKANLLSQQETAELERHLMLEHLVRLAKAHAYQQVRQQA
jgi:hypothetical protein